MDQLCKGSMDQIDNKVFTCLLTYPFILTVCQPVNHYFIHIPCIYFE